MLWLSKEKLSASVGADRVLRVDSRLLPGAAIASLTWADGSYVLEAAEGREVWINGRAVARTRLSHLDMIEFGPDGPMSRFRLCDQAFPAHWSVDDIIGDAVAYARTSRKPLLPRLSNAVLQSGQRIVSQSTIFFRVSVVVVLVLLSVLGAVLYQNDRLFEERLKREAQRIAAVDMALSQAQQEALTPADLAALRQELELQVTTNADRLERLEERSNAPARVIRESARSVAFIQGAFALRHAESGRLLHHVVDAQGNPLTTPFGQPWIDPHGTGDTVEFQFTGTGFLIGAGDMIVTNRHIVRPWTIGERARSFRESGLEPEILKLIAYLPGRIGALEISQNRVSETSDLAVFDILDPPRDRTGLLFADAPSSAGAEVLVMGFPTGLRALVAQAGPTFLAEMEENKNGSAQFWNVATRLSERDLIWPLASRGIVAQVNAETVVYDAETTVGGSGGPVLDIEGRVVAITAAILPEFGGSNLGVPVAQLRDLVEPPKSQ